MTSFVILLGGHLSRTDRLISQLDGARFIAADGGIRHADLLGVTPELWVGDFDSADQTLLDRYSSVPRQVYPAEKALTDGEIAIETARKAGADRLILAGALGGARTDHGLAHLVHALSLARSGMPIFLTSGDEEAYPLLPGLMSLDLPDRSLLSIIGFDDLEGLTIENVRYPLTNFSLPFGSSRTISNVARGTVRFRLGSGRAIILARPYDFSGV